MNTRLQDIIKYKTGGRQKDFAETLGWTPQYLAKLLRGENFGLKPVQTILQAFPEINARWLLLGEGNMIGKDQLRSVSYALVENLVNIEKFVPVMSPEELGSLHTELVSGRIPTYSEPQLADWDQKLQAKHSSLQLAISEAIYKSDELCKQRTAKK